MIIRPPKRAVYARHASKLQNVRSTADQIAALREATPQESTEYF